MSNSILNRQLGDKFLDDKENVAREREELLAEAHKNKIHGQDEMKADRSEGARLHSSELLMRLRKICPRLMIRDGIPGNVALYRPKTENEMRTDGYDLTAPEWYNENKYSTGFELGWVPEWGNLTTDTDGVANREVRGWRSILIAFVKQGLCTYTAAVEEFGDPMEDLRSKFWFENLNEFRRGTRSSNV